MNTGAGEAIILVVYLAVLLITIIGGWKMFAKAGQPGWASIIPIFNVFIMLKIAGRPWWWLVALFIPIINIVAIIIVWNDISKSFGRGVGTTLGLFFLPMIFVPILGFGSAEYQGPSAG